jgi:bifunctional UDP-N-acetylglucosamine pyrophosphorylase/glucosamine-1-phosphate N-acetyltransferase
MKTFAVIPAAGRGSRLGIQTPKILVPIAGTRTVWSILHSRLQPLVDHIHVVVAPTSLGEFEAALETTPHSNRISVSVQSIPIGMGDAIFGALEHWQTADTIMIIWGDQIHVSSETLQTALNLHARSPKCLTIPLVAQPTPYVEYSFSSAGTLSNILQSREGDQCNPGGLSDVGTFILSTDGLAAAWNEYVSIAARGSRTNEVNFLPFLCWLSAIGWEVRTHTISDITESRGINTLDDLLFFRSKYSPDC